MLQEHHCKDFFAPSQMVSTVYSMLIIWQKKRTFSVPGMEGGMQCLVYEDSVVGSLSQYERPQHQ